MLFYYYFIIILLFYFINFLFQALELLLPTRTPVEIPVGEHVEEVSLTDFDPSHDRQSNRREAYQEDEDMEDSGGQKRPVRTPIVDERDYKFRMNLFVCRGPLDRIFNYVAV